MSDETTYAGFVRKRRFLVAVSFALAAAEYLGLGLEKLNILGNEADIDHPERVMALGYVVWIWALVTYMQWFHDYGAWSKTVAAVLTARNDLLVRAKAMRDARPPGEMLEPFKKKIHTDVLGALERNVDTTRPEEVEMRIHPASILQGHDGGLWCSLDLSAVSKMQPAGEKSWGSAGHFRVRVSRSLRARITAKAILHVAVNTRFISEFFAPFAIALLPLVALLWQLCGLGFTAAAIAHGADRIFGTMC